jgi:hypothetical protein
VSALVQSDRGFDEFTSLELGELVFAVLATLLEWLLVGHVNCQYSV